MTAPEDLKDNLRGVAKAAEGFRPPQEVAESLVEGVCVKKAELPFLKMLLLGILAGVYISFGGQLMTVVTSDLSKVSFGLAKFIGGSVFSVGLMLVVIAGAELFTGNTLMLAGVLGEKISL